MPTTPPSIDIHTQPHSSDSEKTVLGALFLDPDAIAKVAEMLEADDFYDPTYKRVYEAARRLYDSQTPVDFITVTEALQEDEKIQSVGGSAFLAELAADVPTSSHIEAYAKRVREYSLKRRAIQLADKIEAYAYDPEQSADDVLEAAEQGILQLSRQSANDTTVDLANLRDERFQHYTDVYEAEDKSVFYGLTTGFPDLDNKLLGLPKGDLIVIAARPSMGKTAFAMDIARHVTTTLEKQVLLISLELSKEQIMDRVSASALGVSTHDLRKGLIKEEDFMKMGKVFDGMPKQRIFIDDDFDSRLVRIRSKARRQQMKHGLDLLIVDYLQLISVGGNEKTENRVQEVSKISRGLKKLAGELCVPVIAVSQLSRNPENRPNKEPLLSDLRESGSIEQDADTVLMLYREDYHFEDTDRKGITDVFIRKQRQGPTGRIEVRFDKKRMQHQSLAKQRTETTPTL